MPTKRLTDEEIVEIINTAGPMASHDLFVATSRVVFNLAIELQEYRSVPVFGAKRHDDVLPERKPTPVEALAERLAKVEDRLAVIHGEVHQRIDKVVDIVGERVSELVEQIANHEALIEQLVGGLADWGSGEPAFPTGGASTAEAATDAVLPVPQRGDRVRLEGALTTASLTLHPGWYEVTGQDGHSFQVRVGEGSLALYWVLNGSPGLKEVRHDH